MATTPPNSMVQPREHEHLLLAPPSALVTASSDRSTSVGTSRVDGPASTVADHVLLLGDRGAHPRRGAGGLGQLGRPLAAREQALGPEHHHQHEREAEEEVRGTR